MVPPTSICITSVANDTDTGRWKQTELLFEHVFGGLRNKSNEDAFQFLHAFLEKNHTQLDNTQLAWFFTMADRKSYTGLNANTFNYMLMSSILAMNQRMMCSLFGEANKYFTELNDNSLLNNKEYGEAYSMVLRDFGDKLSVYSEASPPKTPSKIFDTISVYSNNVATTLRSQGVFVYTEMIKLERISQPPDWMRVKFDNAKATEVFKEVEVYKSTQGTPFNKLLGALIGDQVNPETGKPFPGALVAAMNGTFTKEIKMYSRYLQVLAAQQVVPSLTRV